MFCLGQLGAIAGGVLMVRLCRRIYLRMITQSGMESKFPAFASWFAEYGWLLVIVPILCVLLIPRHREDEAAPQLGWVATSVGLMGSLVLGYAFIAVFASVIQWFRPF
jgi:hypothetical protein